MVIEHTFVTTLPPTEAMHAAADFLSARGFTSASAPRAFAVGDTSATVWDQLEVRRGRDPLSAGRARHLMQSPQQVRLEWDRGRMTVAASITDRFSKKDRVALLTAIATGLDRLLAQRQPPEIAAADWAAVEARLQRARKRNRWVTITVAVVFGLVLAIVIALVSQHR